MTAKNSTLTIKDLQRVQRCRDFLHEAFLSYAYLVWGVFRLQSDLEAEFEEEEDEDTDISEDQKKRQKEEQTERVQELQIQANENHDKYKDILSMEKGNATSSGRDDIWGIVKDLLSDVKSTAEHIRTKLKMCNGTVIKIEQGNSVNVPTECLKFLEKFSTDADDERQSSRPCACCNSYYFPEKLLLTKLSVRNVKVRISGGSVVKKYPEAVRNHLHEYFPDLECRVNVINVPSMRNSTANCAVDSIVSMFKTWGMQQDLPLFILSNYTFQNYLKNVCWPKGMQVTCQDGDFDVIIIGMHVGIILIEVKGAQKENPKKKVTKSTKQHIRKACTQLTKYDLVLKEMNRDWGGIFEIPVTKIIGMPFLNAGEDIVRRCVPPCSEKCKVKGDNSSTFSELDICERHYSNILTGSILKDLESFTVWMTKILSVSPLDKPFFSFEGYQILCERFVGIASVVDVHSPQENNKKVTEVILKAFLTPAQKKLLHSCQPFLAVAGDYGTGKSLLLVEKALKAREEKNNFKGNGSNHNQFEGKCLDEKDINTYPCPSKEKACIIENEGLSPSPGIDFLTDPSNNPFFPSSESASLIPVSQCPVPERDKLCEIYSCCDRKELDLKMFEDIPPNKSKVFLISCTDISIDGKKCDLLFPELSVNHLCSKMLRNNPRGVFVTKFGPLLFEGFNPKPSKFFVDIDSNTFLQAIEKVVSECKLDSLHLFMDEVPLRFVDNFYDVFKELCTKPYMKTLWITIATHSYRVDVKQDQDPKWIGGYIPQAFHFEYLTVNFRSPENVLIVHRETETSVGDGHVKATHGKVALGPYPLSVTVPGCTCGIQFTPDQSPLNCRCSQTNMTSTLKTIIHALGDISSQDVTFLLFGVEHEGLHIQLCDLLKCCLDSMGLNAFEETTLRPSEKYLNLGPGTILITEETAFVGCESSVLVCVDPNCTRQWDEGNMLGYTTVGISRTLSQYIHLTWPDRESEFMYDLNLQDYEDGIHSNKTLSNEEREIQQRYLERARSSKNKFHKILVDKNILEVLPIKVSQQIE